MFVFYHKYKLNSSKHYYQVALSKVTLNIGQSGTKLETEVCWCGALMEREHGLPHPICHISWKLLNETFTSKVSSVGCSFAYCRT